jgi:hypothetical protein
VTLAVLLAVAGLAAPPPATAAQEPGYRTVEVTYYGIKKHHHKTRRACRRHSDRRCRRHVIRRRVLIPTPAPPAPAPAPTPTPAPPPLPSRTAVDLAEWRVSPAYRELAAGEVELNAANLGEDDHDLSIRDATDAKLETVALAPGQSASVRLTLAAGSYTLYCSLPGHEAAGMRAKVTVR